MVDFDRLAFTTVLALGQSPVLNVQVSHRGPTGKQIVCEYYNHYQWALRNATVDMPGRTELLA